ncbi:hypothetical protein RCL1_009158 [Eukaryota sp. TZLM3-RCL]
MYQTAIWTVCWKFRNLFNSEISSLLQFHRMELETTPQMPDSLYSLYTTEFFFKLRLGIGGVSVMRENIESRFAEIRRTIASTPTINNRCSQSRGRGKGRRGSSNAVPVSREESHKADNLSKEGRLSAALQHAKNSSDNLCNGNSQDVQNELALMCNKDHFLTKLLSEEEFSDFGAKFIDYLFTKAVQNAFLVPLYTAILKKVLSTEASVSSCSSDSFTFSFTRSCVGSIQGHITQFYVDEDGWNVENELQLNKITREKSGEIVNEKTMEIERFYKQNQLRDQVFNFVKFVAILVSQTLLPDILLLEISRVVLDNPYKPYSIEVVISMWKVYISLKKSSLCDQDFWNSLQPVINRFELLRDDENLMFETRSLCVDFLAYYTEQCTTALEQRPQKSKSKQK